MKRRNFLAMPVATGAVGLLNKIDAFAKQSEGPFSVPENPADAERVIRDFAQKGNNLIVTTSFGSMEPNDQRRQRFPRCTVHSHLGVYSG